MLIFVLVVGFVPLCIFADMIPKQRLVSLCEEAAVNIEGYKKRLAWIAFFRLFTILIGGFCVFLFWGMSLLVCIVSLFTIAVFLLLVKKHNAENIQLKIEKAFLLNCHNEIKYAEGNWRDKAEGREYLDAEHPYINDLNIFGKHSLFQYLDRTKTRYAQHKFAETLKTTPTDVAKILEEREVIKELSTDPDFVLRLLSTAQFNKVDVEYFESISDWVNERSEGKSSLKTMALLYVVPAIVVSATVAYALDFITGNALLLTFLLPAILVMSQRKKNQKKFDAITSLLERVDTFEIMLANINRKDFHSPVLKQRIQDAKLTESPIGIRRLQRIVGAIESRNNVVMAILVNLYLMWDFRCVKRIEDWKGQYGDQLAGWLKVGLDLEAYASWALYVFNHPSFVYPEFSSHDEFYLKEARHVLMDASAVPNSLSLIEGKAFSIITGANMAGKSTYLRTIGSSLILGMNGAPVYADSFKFQPRALFTSMLSSDSLGDNESYFFNELKRLRKLVDKLEAGEPQFVILDEILKGTNSVDKAEGARKFLSKLLTLPATGLVATHDLSLCELVDQFPTQIENAKFEVKYFNDELLFEYKLEPGICQNMNANFLLKKMGLVNE